MALTFDSQFYLSNNADVLAAVIAGTMPDALTHFILFGQNEGRDPNEFFDTSFYLANNADVQNALNTLPAGTFNVLDHYNVFGTTSAEGRDPNANFDVSFYLAQNADVAAAVDAGLTDALTHWNEFGRFEGRAAVDTFGNLIAAGTEITTITPVVTGQTFTLTTGVDAFTGTSLNDTFDGSGFFNAGTGTTLQTLGNGDSLDGGAGTDTLNALIATAAVFTPSSLANMEVINGTFTAAGTLNLANATGVTTLSSLNSAAVAALFTNVQSAPTAFNITNASANFTATVVNTALSGTADAATLTLQSVTAGTVTLQTVTAASGYETLNIVSGGNIANTLTALTGGNGNSLATINVSGAQNLNLGTTLDATVTTIDASTMTGALTVVQTAAVKTTITGGSGNDVIDVSTAFVDGTDATNADVIDGGAGTDSLQLTSAEVAAVTAAAQWSNVTNIETVIMDTVVAANLNFTFLTGVTTIEFDGGIGPNSHTVASGTEIQYDLLDADNDAQTFTITGSATTDTLTIDINGVDMGAGAQTYTGIETLNIATSGTSLMDGTLVMTPSAATQTVNISGTGTLTIGNITANVVDASGMTAGTLNLGTFQAATQFTGGASADTVVGSTSADIMSGGAGVDALTNTASGANVTAGDILTGGGGFDTFTLIGSSASAVSYLGSPNITDFTVGTSATNTDFIRLSSVDADYGAGLSVTGTGAGAAGSVGVQTVAQNAAAAAAATGAEFIKLTTAVAFNTNLQTTFNDAIGTATVTGVVAASTFAGSYYDTTNSTMVLFEVLSTATATTTIETGDVVRLIGTIDMSAADYANIDTDNFANFL